VAEILRGSVAEMRALQRIEERIRKELTKFVPRGNPLPSSTRVGWLLMVASSIYALIAGICGHVFMRSCSPPSDWFLRVGMWLYSFLALALLTSALVFLAIGAVICLLRRRLRKEASECITAGVRQSDASNNVLFPSEPALRPLFVRDVLVGFAILYLVFSVPFWRALVRLLIFRSMDTHWPISWMFPLIGFSCLTFSLLFLSLAQIIDLLSIAGNSGASSPVSPVRRGKARTFSGR